MKRVAVAGAALAVVLVLVGLVYGQARTPLPVPVTASAGRFHVVNGTPELTKNIMLLDSVTGETWIYCSDTNGVTGWCYMPRWTGTTGTTPAPKVP
jgi:hypothetical protein